MHILLTHTAVRPYMLLQMRSISCLLHIFYLCIFTMTLFYSVLYYYCILKSRLSLTLLKYNE